MDFAHFVITRWNVRTAFSPKEGLSPDWFRERLAIFRHFTVPSMAKQTNRLFTWICCIDPTTDSAVRDRIHEIIREVDFRSPFVLLDTPRPFNETLIKYLLEQMAEAQAPEYIITTRLDNDDALGIHHIAQMQICLDRLPRLPLRFADFSSGFSYNIETGTLKEVIKFASAFSSCMERVSPTLKTIYQGNHRQLPELGPFVQFRGNEGSVEKNPGYFLEIIHGRNIKNRDRDNEPLPSWIVPEILRGRFGVEPWKPVDKNQG